MCENLNSEWEEFVGGEEIDGVAGQSCGRGWSGGDLVYGES